MKEDCLEEYESFPRGCFFDLRFSSAAPAHKKVALYQERQVLCVLACHIKVSLTQRIWLLSVEMLLHWVFPVFLPPSQPCDSLLKGRVAAAEVTLFRSLRT